MPKLSIITVNLNNAEGLRKTIESVVSQTYTDFEYLIIDGGSKDGSVDIIKEYSDKITYWVSEPDKGIYNAMNKGIEKACGDYLLFLNSGDYLFDNKVISNVNNEIKQEDEIIVGNVIIDYGSKDRVKVHPIKISPEFFLNSTICHQAAFFKRELFKKYGLYDENYLIVSDKDFFIKTLITNNVNYKHVAINIAYFDVTGIGTIDSTLAIRDDESKRILNTYFSKPVIETLEKYQKVKFIVENRGFKIVIKVLIFIHSLKIRIFKFFDLFLLGQYSQAFRKGISSFKRNYLKRQI